MSAIYGLKEKEIQIFYLNLVLKFIHQFKSSGVDILSSMNSPLYFNSLSGPKNFPHPHLRLFFQHPIYT